MKHWTKRFLGGRDPLSRRAFELARWLYYIGWRFSCPCCGAHLRKFASIPRVGADDLECPGCGSYARHRQLWLFLVCRVGVLRERMTLLHVAPETFFYRHLESAPNLRYVSADIEAAHAQHRFDIASIPYPAEHFDCVICSHVLEHVADDRAAMRELHRVLRRGGSAIIQAPVQWGMQATVEDVSVTDPAERARRFGAGDHVRLYGADYLNRLEDAGFQVEVEPFAIQIDSALARRYGILPIEPIYLCRKE